MRSIVVAVAALTALAAAEPTQAYERWSQPPQVLGAQTAPEPGSVAALPDGTVIGAWAEGSRVVGAVAPPGRPFGAATALVDDVPGPVEGVRLATGPQGDTVMVWTTPQGAEGRVVRAAIRPAGGAFGVPVTLSQPSSRSLQAKVAVGGSGQAVVVWRRYTPSGHVVEAAVRAPGGAFGPAEALSGIGTHDETAAAVDASGTALAAWKTNASGYRVRVAQRPAGTAWQPAATVSADDLRPYSLGMAADGTGRVLVVWGSSPAVGQALARLAERGPDGSFAAPRTLSDPAEQAFGTQVAAGGQGDAVVAWERGAPSEAGSTQQIGLAVTRRAPGGDFGNPEDLSQAASGVNTQPRVAVDARGHAVAAWRQQTGSIERIATVRALRAGAWSVPEAVGEEDASLLPAVPAAGGEGAAVIAWLSTPRDGGARSLRAVHRTAAAAAPTGGVGPAPDAGTGAGPVAAPPEDALPPSLRVSAPRRTRLTARGFLLTVRASEAVRLRVTGRVVRRATVPVSRKLTTAGSLRIRVRPGARTLRAVRRALARRRTVTLTLRVIGVDPTGRRAVVPKRVTLRR